MTGPVVPGTGWPGDLATPATPAATSAESVVALAAAAGSLAELTARQSVCRACPRLVEWREEVAATKRRSFANDQYWGRPVPGWGDERPSVLIVGLAPAAHGGNRTGRIFTGDRSGDVLFESLWRCGLAARRTSVTAGDGQRLRGVRMMAAVRCAPPQNKPTPKEIANCAGFLDREMAALKNVKIVVALGRIGFEAYLNYLKRSGLLKSKAGIAFAHAAHYEMPDGRILLCSYHPSQQNTQTGKLTEKMFLEIFKKARKLLKSSN